MIARLCIAYCVWHVPQFIHSFVDPINDCLCTCTHILNYVCELLDDLEMLTTGISASQRDLSWIGKQQIIILMFIGRVGVLTFGFALLQREQVADEVLLKDDLAV